MIKFASYLWQIVGFLGVLRFPPPAELLLKVAKDIINHKPVIGNYYTFGWLVGLMVFNITSNNISVISRWRKLEDLEETTNLSQVSDKLCHIMLYTSP